MMGKKSCKKYILKIISNKTSNNQNNRDHILHVKKLKEDEIKKIYNFINYFKKIIKRSWTKPEGKTN
jgi:hypothetical protein